MPLGFLVRIEDSEDLLIDQGALSFHFFARWGLSLVPLSAIALAGLGPVAFEDLADLLVLLVGESDLLGYIRPGEGGGTFSLQAEFFEPFVLGVIEDGL